MISRDQVAEWLNDLKGVLGEEHSDDPAVGDYESECPVCVTLRAMRVAVSEREQLCKK